MANDKTDTITKISESIRLLVADAQRLLDERHRLLAMRMKDGRIKKMRKAKI